MEIHQRTHMYTNIMEIHQRTTDAAVKMRDIIRSGSFWNDGESGMLLVVCTKQSLGVLERVSLLAYVHVSSNYMLHVIFIYILEIQQQIRKFVFTQHGDHEKCWWRSNESPDSMISLTILYRCSFHDKWSNLMIHDRDSLSYNI
jgi:hypothetical protein